MSWQGTKVCTMPGLCVEKLLAGRPYPQEQSREVNLWLGLSFPQKSSKEHIILGLSFSLCTAQDPFPFLWINNHLIFLWEIIPYLLQIWWGFESVCPPFFGQDLSSAIKTLLNLNVKPMTEVLEWIHFTMLPLIRVSIHFCCHDPKSFPDYCLFWVL